MKQQGLTLPQASKFVKENNLYKKAEKVVKIVGGKSVNRKKKAQKWTDYAVHTANDGLDLAKKGKKIFGFGMSAGAKRPASKWIMFVKEYASKHNISYKDALKQAGPSYKNSK